MKKQENFILKLYQSKNTVFTINEISLLLSETNRENLKAKLNYYVKRKRLKNVRKGIYTKIEYDPLELITKIYTPSYISLETVLEKEGVIFQHYKTVFVVSYLTRRIEVDKCQIQYRRIKERILLNQQGVIQKENYATATIERAFLDALYLYKNYYFDNLDALDSEKVFQLLSIYQSKNLTKKVKGILKND